jgi:hypothetical protein
MSTAHTPGPWLAEPSTDNRKTWHVVAPCGLRLAWRIGSPNEAQDARLIAAAPDLLAALKGILSITHRDHVAWDAARAAIAKAEGGAA